MFLNKYLVEFLGSTFFIYVILSTGNALAVGASLALIIILTINISGGYINPTVTIAMAAAGKLPYDEILPYSVSQILGGLVAVEIYRRVAISE